MLLFPVLTLSDVPFCSIIFSLQCQCKIKRAGKKNTSWFNFESVLLTCGFSWATVFAVWLCGRAPVPGHPHHRALPGLHFQHRVLPASLGSQLGSCSYVQPPKNSLMQSHAVLFNRRVSLCIYFWALLWCFQSCRRCCGPWWCAWVWGSPPESGWRFWCPCLASLQCSLCPSC